MNNFDNYVFANGSDKITIASSSNKMNYGLFGYNGGGSGFNKLILDGDTLRRFLFPVVDVNLSTASNSDVVIVLGDEQTFSSFYNTQLLYGQFISNIDQFIIKSEQIFDGSCMISRLSKNGELKKVVSMINLSKDYVGRFAVGISSYFGIDNVANLRQGEIIKKIDGGDGYILNEKLISVIRQMSGSKISSGTTRDKSHELLISLFKSKQAGN